MIVYVETNFLLELAYLQERCASCDEILQMAASDRINLILPAFSIAEARATWQRRASERREVHASLQKHIREISRSEPFRSLNEQSREVVAALVAHGEQARERLEEAVQAVERHGTIVALSSEIVTVARVHEILYSLSPQDALVLESVRSHAEQAAGPKCFITQDVKGFANPSIYDELSRVQCKVLVNFTDAVAYIRSALEPPG